MVKERVITVEHLVPSMSQELLCKFPDDSAFGFDYSQSQIWSPLLHRVCPFPTSAYKDKIRRTVKDTVFMKKKKKKKKMVMQGIFKKRLEFSPIPTPKMSNLVDVVNKLDVPIGPD
ncbi:hypothetical protein KSP39_PZI021510 [Platanthera zijinensis]|uniref:Uncharacterized protein n=1 Tax=Platanthera zijinensis TaxID=2320716 RepID=A0AAP0AYQ9_9ASPA